jgi:hypothetical protein
MSFKKRVKNYATSQKEEELLEHFENIGEVNKFLTSHC